MPRGFREKNVAVAVELPNPRMARPIDPRTRKTYKGTMMD